MSTTINVNTYPQDTKQTIEQTTQKHTITPKETHETYATLVSNNMQLRFMLGYTIPEYKQGFCTNEELHLA